MGSGLPRRMGSMKPLGFKGKIYRLLARVPAVCLSIQSTAPTRFAGCRQWPHISVVRSRIVRSRISSSVPHAGAHAVEEWLHEVMKGEDVLGHWEKPRYQRNHTSSSDSEQPNLTSEGGGPMARESTQHKLNPVRPPRVHITYDVEIGDAIE